MISTSSKAVRPRNVRPEKCQYVSFWVDGQLLGVPVQAVQEVLNAQPIARIPRSRPEIAGLLNLRGQIVTAVDLRKRLGLPPLGEGQASMNVVLRVQGESFSLLVDEVGDVIEMECSAVVSAPRTLDARWKKVTSGILCLEGRLLILLNVATVLGVS